MTDETKEPEGVAYTLSPDGKIERRQFDKSPPLAWLQEQVGGYIESVPHFDIWDGFSCVAYANEEGRTDRLAPNFLASLIWAGNLGPGPWRYPPVLHGPVVILIGTAAFLTGEETNEEPAPVRETA